MSVFSPSQETNLRAHLPDLLDIKDMECVSVLTRCEFEEIVQKRGSSAGAIIFGPVIASSIGDDCVIKNFCESYGYCGIKRWEEKPKGFSYFDKDLAVLSSGFGDWHAEIIKEGLPKRSKAFPEIVPALIYSMKNGSQVSLVFCLTETPIAFDDNNNMTISSNEIDIIVKIIKEVASDLQLPEIVFVTDFFADNMKAV